MAKQFKKVALPMVPVDDGPLTKREAHDWLKRLATRINEAIESLVGGINTSSGLWGAGETIEINIDNDAPYYSNEQEIAIRHHLGTVPRGFLITRETPHRLDYYDASGPSTYTWNGTQGYKWLVEGRSPWTNEYVYFYPTGPAVFFRLHLKVFLIR